MITAVTAHREIYGQQDRSEWPAGKMAIEQGNGTEAMSDKVSDSIRNT